MKKFNLFCLAILLLLSFSFNFIGCSGGGGGDEGGGFVDTNQPLALNSNNAVAVSGLVVEGNGGAIAAGSLGENVIASANAPSGGGFIFSFLYFAQDVAERIWTMYEQGTLTTPSVIAAQVPDSVACSDGGTVDAIWNDRDNDNNLSEGDSITLNFKGCVEDDVTFNGTLSVFVLDLVGDPETDDSWVLVLRLNFDTLTASGGGSFIEIIGSLDVTVEQLAPDEFEVIITTEVGIGSGSTSSSFLYFGEGEDFTELTLFTLTFKENPDGSFTLTSEGTLRSSFIGGKVTFRTTPNVNGDDFDNNDPSAGEMIITGAANSSILLRILNSVNVALDVDNDGDGAIDDTIPTSWDEMSDAADAL